MVEAFLQHQICEAKVFLAFAGYMESLDVDEPYKKISFGLIWVNVISKAGLFFFSKLFYSRFFSFGSPGGPYKLAPL